YQCLLKSTAAQLPAPVLPQGLSQHLSRRHTRRTLGCKPTREPGGTLAATRCPSSRHTPRLPQRGGSAGQHAGHSEKPTWTTRWAARATNVRTANTRRALSAPSNCGRRPNNARQQRNARRGAAPRRSQPSGPLPAPSRSRSGRRRPSPRPLISWRRPVRLRSSAIARSISCKERSGSPLASSSRGAARPPLPAEAMLPPPAMISCQAAPAARTALPVAAAGGAGGRSTTATREPNGTAPLLSSRATRRSPAAPSEFPGLCPTRCSLGLKPPRAPPCLVRYGTARPSPTASCFGNREHRPALHQPMVRRRAGRREGFKADPRLLCRWCWRLKLSGACLRSRARSRVVSLPPEYLKERPRVSLASSIRCCSC
ncbi:hypothetical protein CIB84_009711, partial [Bambusicola thoracicus]